MYKMNYRHKNGNVTNIIIRNLLALYKDSFNPSYCRWLSFMPINVNVDWQSTLSLLLKMERITLSDFYCLCLYLCFDSFYPPSSWQGKVINFSLTSGNVDPRFFSMVFFQVSCNKKKIIPLNLVKDIFQLFPWINYRIFFLP